MSVGIEAHSVDLDAVFAPTHAGWAQAATTGIQKAGADISTRYALLSAGTAAAVTGIDKAGTDLNTRYAALGTTGVIVLTQPGNVVGSAAAGSPSGVVTSNTTTCVGEKGGGAYTYTWHFVGAVPAGVAFTAPNAAITAVRGTAVPAGTTQNGQMYCTISDGVTSVNTQTKTWSLTNTTPSGFNFTLLAGVSGSTVGFRANNYGQINGSYNPTPLPSGYYILQATSDSTVGTVLTVSGVGVDPGQASLTGFTINGHTFTGAGAFQYTYANQEASWLWSANAGLANGAQYAANITGTIEA